MNGLVVIYLSQLHFTPFDKSSVSFGWMAVLFEIGDYLLSLVGFASTQSPKSFQSPPDDVFFEHIMLNFYWSCGINIMPLCVVLSTLVSSGLVSPQKFDRQTEKSSKCLQINTTRPC